MHHANLNLKKETQIKKKKREDNYRDIDHNGDIRNFDGVIPETGDFEVVSLKLK